MSTSDKEYSRKRKEILKEGRATMRCFRCQGIWFEFAFKDRLCQTLCLQCIYDLEDSDRERIMLNFALVREQERKTAGPNVSQAVEG